jgi:hypothetical protein
MLYKWLLQKQEQLNLPDTCKQFPGFFHSQVFKEYQKVTQNEKQDVIE